MVIHLTLKTPGVETSDINDTQRCIGHEGSSIVV